MTTKGDLIVGGISGGAQRLAAGTSGYALNEQREAVIFLPGRP